MTKFEEYKNAKGLSYSRLSKLSVHPRNLIATEKEESSALSFGSLVDCLMFSADEFDEKFYQTVIKRPGGEMLKWLDAYLNYELPADYTLNDHDKIILKAREVSGYNKSLLNATALRKFHEECDAFLHEIAKAGDKIIITNDDFNRAINYQSRLLNNEFTWPYFAPSGEFQKEIYFELEGTKCKGLLDGVIFNNLARTIKPWDLKTSSESTLSFEREFIKWRYYLQAALYRAGLQTLYPDYKVLPFDFIVINDWEEPFIWRVEDQLHSLSMMGGQLRNGHIIKGVYELIEEFKWHEQNDKYDYPVDFYSKGYKSISLL